MSDSRVGGMSTENRLEANERPYHGKNKTTVVESRKGEGASINTAGSAEK